MGKDISVALLVGFDERLELKIGSALPSTNIGICLTFVPVGTAVLGPGLLGAEFMFGRGGDFLGGGTGCAPLDSGTLGAEADVLIVLFCLGLEPRLA